MRINKTAATLICVAAVAFGVARLVSWSRKPSVEHDASRLLVCEACGSVTVLDPEMIRDAHENGNVRNTEQGARFACLSCGEFAARAENLDFDEGAIRCQRCGNTLIDNQSEAFKAIRRGDMKLDDKSQLTFRCDRCNEFSGRMTARADSADEQSASQEK